MWNAGAQRKSHSIGRHPAVNIHHARRFAEDVGHAFNVHVSLNLSMCGFSPELASRVWQRLISQRFSPWLRRTALQDGELSPTYVWTLEAPHGGVGVHWLVHLPDRLVPLLKPKLVGWIKGLGGTLPPGALAIGEIHNVIGMTRYVLKGIEPVWSAHLAVRPVSQGMIIGKRSGFSRSLGPTSRKRSGYRPRRVYTY